MCHCCPPGVGVTGRSDSASDSSITSGIAGVFCLQSFRAPILTPHCDRLMLAMTEETLIMSVGASHFVLLLEESGEEMTETSTSRGSCARFSPDCASVFVEMKTLEQFISRMVAPGCVQTRDACCYCLALHIMSAQAATNTCEGSKIVSCSAPLRWDPFTLPAHTLSVLQLRTVKHLHILWIRVKPHR